MSKRVITLATDFGTDSPYAAAMKGVILAINPQATLVDITHSIPPQDVRQGAIVLANVCPRFPADAIHIAVVDPGVGTDRRLVFARIGNQQYLAPDNGLLSRLAKRDPPRQIVTLSEPAFWLKDLSDTFHGRDILAPVAARISLGVDPDLLGPKLSRLVELDWPEPRLESQRLVGEVETVDRFGNLITNITRQDLAGIARHQPLRVKCGARDGIPIVRTYGAQPKGTIVALVGSGGCLEVAVVEGSAARELSAVVGVAVAIEW
jgi:S-adenosylmethionine hydrolase